VQPRQDKLVKAVFDDIASINNSVPVRGVLLKRALSGERSVLLRDGSEHLMDQEEIESLADSLPSWMKWVVEIPFVLAYNPKGGTLKVLGPEWNEKAIRVLLSIERDEPIRLYHLERLISRFASLTFVLFEVDAKSIIGGDEG